MRYGRGNAPDSPRPAWRRQLVPPFARAAAGRLGGRQLYTRYRRTSVPVPRPRARL